MDVGVLVGLIVALVGVIGGNIVEGGKVSALFNISAMMIIFGGTIGATMVSVGMGQFMRMPKLIGAAFKKPHVEPHQVVESLVAFAQKARREGLLALEEEVQNLQDKFMAKGLQMVVDGADPEMVEGVLLTEVSLEEKRKHTDAAMFEAAGGFAPTMGIIGTVLGLIHVLSSLENPDELGPAISVAFLATFWGIFIANLFFLPLAGKLKANAKEETEMKEMIVEGILSIQKGDSPTIVREKLQAFLSPEARAKPAEGKAAGGLQAGEEHA